MIVMKFGGSSVADAERIANVASIVRGHVARRPVVVVSALGGVTDLLERALDAAREDDLERLEPLVADVERRHRWALAGSIANARSRHHLGLEIDREFEQLRQRLRSIRVLGEDTPRARDAVLACGETLSALLVVEAFRERELPATLVDPRRVMVTNDHFGRAVADPEAVASRCRDELLPSLQRGELPVLGGFVGATPAGETTTLGRGGSDTTAAVLGLALAAEEIQIWSDVDGMMSADPRLVAGARTLERVSFAEAAELALYGVKVLHPDSIAPAVQRQIPVRVLNSSRPDGAGTLVVDESRADAAAAAPVALASKRGMSVVRLYSRRLPMPARLVARAIDACEDAGFAPQLVLSSPSVVTIVVPETERLAALDGLRSEAEISTVDGRAIVGVVGSAVVRDEMLRRKVLGELARWNPDLVAAGALRAGIVAVVAERELTEGVRRLHARFFEREERAWTTH